MVLRARWVLLVSIVVGVGIWGYFLAQGRGSVPKYRTAVVGRDKARTGSEMASEVFNSSSPVAAHYALHGGQSIP